MVAAEAICLVDQQHGQVLAPARKRQGNQPAGEPATQDRDICPFFSHCGSGAQSLTRNFVSEKSRFFASLEPAS